MDWRWTDSLGVALMGHGIAGRAGDCGRAAERAGLGSVWIIEDYFQPGAYTLAAAAAAVTESIAVGLGVVNPYTRHPALIPMKTAALAGLPAGPRAPRSHDDVVSNARRVRGHQLRSAGRVRRW